MTTKTMEEIFVTLKQASFGTVPFNELPYSMQSMISNKAQLLKQIEGGFITDVKHAEKWLELIELIYDWAQNTFFDYEHRLFFNEGIIEIDSISECCGGDWVLDYKDNQLFLDGEEFGDSIVHLLNWIEGCL